MLQKSFYAVPPFSLFLGFYSTTIAEWSSSGTRFTVDRDKLSSQAIVLISSLHLASLPACLLGTYKRSGTMGKVGMVDWVKQEFVFLLELQ